MCLAEAGVFGPTVTAVDHGADTARVAYVISAVALGGLAVVSLFTGFKVRFLPYRLCPAIFTISAALILAGMPT